MQSVSAFSLTNNAAEVVAIAFSWWDGNGKKHTTGPGEYFPINQSRTLSPGDAGVPVGAAVSLHVDVRLGSDREAKEMFVYDPNSSYVAAYSITGTTLDSHLHLLNPVAATADV